MKPKLSQAQASPGRTLCYACGFCCSGVLFTAVKLQTTDDPASLSALGLGVEKRGRSYRFSQPCPAFNSGECAIYSERPGYCAKFECRLLQKLNLGETKLETAIAVITRAKKELAVLEEALIDSGDREPHLALNTRFRRVMSRPLDLSSGPGFWKARRRLMKAVQKFTATLEKKFLQ